MLGGRRCIVLTLKNVPPAARLGRAAHARRPKREPHNEGIREKCKALFPEYETAPRRRPFHSPSRSRFRPPNPLTFGFRLRPPGGASTYSRPVLGAIGTLGALPDACKGLRERRRALCEVFFFQHFHSRSCSLWRSPGRAAEVVHTRPDKPAEPVSVRGVVASTSCGIRPAPVDTSAAKGTPLAAST